MRSKYPCCHFSNNSWIDCRKIACYNAGGVFQVQPRMKSWDQALVSTSYPVRVHKLEVPHGAISSKTLDAFDLLNQRTISVSLGSKCARRHACISCDGLAQP